MRKKSKKWGFDSPVPFAYGQRDTTKDPRKGANVMTHKVCINIAKPGGRPIPVVRSGTMQIRKRLLDFLFGKQVNVIVLSPGDTVQTVEIRELKEGGVKYE